MELLVGTRVNTIMYAILAKALVIRCGLASIMHEPSQAPPLSLRVEAVEGAVILLLDECQYPSLRVVCVPSQRSPHFDKFQDNKKRYVDEKIDSDEQIRILELS